MWKQSFQKNLVRYDVKLMSHRFPIHELCRDCTGNSDTWRVLSLKVFFSSLWQDKISSRQGPAGRLATMFLNPHFTEGPTLALYSYSFMSLMILHMRIFATYCACVTGGCTMIIWLNMPIKIKVVLKY